ncbi:MAG: tetratricopeptide repeat protein [Proteobacteria bacterium]|nr:tetratricopeptide repeat protein [Pseudomonadota bacterium]
MTPSPRANDLHALGLTSLQRGDPEGAISLIGKAVAMRPQDAQAQNNLGIAFRALGSLAEGEASFRQALAHSRGYVPQSCARQWEDLARGQAVLCNAASLCVAKRLLFSWADASCA